MNSLSATQVNTVLELQDSDDSNNSSDEDWMEAGSKGESSGSYSESEELVEDEDGAIVLTDREDEDEELAATAPIEEELQECVVCREDVPLVGYVSSFSLGGAIHN